MAFFSQGAARVEDTTIAPHIGVVGDLVDDQWTYRPVDEIADILGSKAARDRQTGKPLLYISSDTHALRRYVDDSWDASWKMINGIRLWCANGDQNGIIHLGGEYTWGDCRNIGERVAALVERLHAIDAQWVFVSDGMPWFRDHIMPHLPKDTTFILDFYHVAERLGEFAAAEFGQGSKASKQWVRWARTMLLGKRDYRRAKSTTR
ncbi:MAG: hypothetical protein AB8H79_00785, partial [Myxococcota bacterium]